MDATGEYVVGNQDMKQEDLKESLLLCTDNRIKPDRPSIIYNIIFEWLQIYILVLQNFSLHLDTNEKGHRCSAAQRAFCFLNAPLVAHSGTWWVLHFVSSLANRP